MALIKADCVINGPGCWLWQRTIGKDGYARLRIASKTVAVHRLVAQAVHGLTDHQPVVHHVCATRRCVNPDHLQPISHRENIAEMLERTYYLERITQLERALRSVAPNHPALTPGEGRQAAA